GESAWLCRGGAAGGCVRRGTRSGREQARPATRPWGGHPPLAPRPPCPRPSPTTALQVWNPPKLRSGVVAAVELHPHVLRRPSRHVQTVAAGAGHSRPQLARAGTVPLLIADRGTGPMITRC